MLICQKCTSNNIVYISMFTVLFKRQNFISLQRYTPGTNQPYIYNAYLRLKNTNAALILVFYDLNFEDFCF